MANTRFTDADLWTRFRNGDRDAFESIYRGHIRALYAFGKQTTDDDDLIADAVQELFIYIWEKRTDLGSTDNIRFYLFKALRRRLIAAVNKEKRSGQIGDTLTVGSNDVVESIEHDLIRLQTDTELRTLLREALRQLTNRQREAIFLRFFGNMSFQEVADIMSLSLRSTYNLISKALDQLRRYFPMLMYAWAVLG